MRLILSLLMLFSFQQAAQAQLLLAANNPVVYGHHHINTSDVAAQNRFWQQGLGGTVARVGSADREVTAFPNVLVFLTEREPTGGTIGSVVNHVGFYTRDIESAVAHLQSMGYPMITQQELPDTYTVVDGIGRREGGNTLAYVLGPDAVKVELILNESIAHAIELHHIHWATDHGAAMQEWYVDIFGAVAGTRIGQPAADLPGVNLTFGPTGGLNTGTVAPSVPTQGRSFDHVGFEVKNLEAFCRRLEAKGITLDRGYTEIESLGIAIAFFTDPWGTYIELTEGLGAVD